MRYWHPSGMEIDVIEPPRFQVVPCANPVRLPMWSVQCLIWWQGHTAWFELRNCDSRDEAMSLMHTHSVEAICDTPVGEVILEVGEILPTVEIIHRRLRR